jgi:hypothetical protein
MTSKVASAVARDVKVVGPANHAELIGIGSQLVLDRRAKLQRFACVLARQLHGL